MCKLHVWLLKIHLITRCERWGTQWQPLRSNRGVRLATALTRANIDYHVCLAGYWRLEMSPARLPHPIRSLWALIAAKIDAAWSLDILPAGITLLHRGRRGA